MATLTIAKAQCLEYYHATSPTVQEVSNRPHVSSSNRWRPPRATYTKINSDTAFNSQKGKGCVGVVCSDENGRVLAAMAAPICAPSALIDACIENKEVREIQSIISDIIFLRSTFEFT